MRSPQFIKSRPGGAHCCFSAVYLATREQPDWVLSSIFAFENGFFCDSVLRSREAKAYTMNMRVRPHLGYLLLGVMLALALLLPRFLAPDEHRLLARFLQDQSQYIQMTSHRKPKQPYGF